ncbi:MAG: hypothetical protein Q8P93_02520 [bacterium]|nr:hypothetical protein [bacterium]
MDVRKYLGSILLLLLLPLTVVAYSDTTTHPALTRKIVEQFNLLYPERAFEKEDRLRVEQGSIDEDIEKRYMQHFYDPVHITGLTFLSFANKRKPWPSALTWAVDTTLQASKDDEYNAEHDLHFSATTDHTWDRAVYEWVYGSKKEALYSLGHIIHLVQDMSVPPHTRDDPHPPVGEFGSIYESYTRQFNHNTIGDIVYRPLTRKYSDIKSLLNGIAIYSNGNFYSRDTTPDKSDRYVEIEVNELAVIEFEGESFQVQKRFYGNDSYYLSKIEFVRDFGNAELDVVYDLGEPSHSVMQDYWRLLSQEALRYGVATIELFFDAVDEEIESGALFALQYPNRHPSGLTQLASLSSAVTTKAPDRASLIRENTEKTAAIDPATSAQLSAQISEARASILNLQTRVEADFALQIDEVQTQFERPPQSLPDQVADISQPEVTNPPAPQLFGVSSTGAGQGSPPASTKQDDEETSDDVTNEPADKEEEPVIEEEVEEPIESSEPEPVADTTAPTLLASIPACSDSFSSSGCVVATSTIILLHSSDADDLAYFEVTIDGVSATTTATSTVYSMASESADISVQAFDISSNASTPVAFTVFSSVRPVVISEIAWSGTHSSYNDEWIELYNNTPLPISLDGWYLYSQSDNSPNIALEGEIAGGGYYLIERKIGSKTDELTESPISGIVADMWVSFGLGLKDTGEPLALVYGSTTIDETPVCYQKWCFGTANKGGIISESRNSMERLHLNAPGADRNAWETWRNLFTYATSTNGSEIYGTPRRRNSNTYALDDVTEGEVTIRAAGGPYVIRGWTIGENTTVTLEPGVVIKSVGVNPIIIRGTLVAKGTEENPIVFTAISDSEYGDLKHNYSQVPQQGRWKNIGFYPTSGASELENVLFRYGGFVKTSQAPDDGSTVFVYGSNPSFKNITVEFSKRHGMVLKNASPLIEDSLIENNGGSGTFGSGTYDSGIYVDGGAPIVRTSTFANNVYGIFSFSTGAIFEDNYFVDNEDPIRLGEHLPESRVRGSYGAGNTRNWIYVIFTPGATTTLSGNEFPFTTGSYITNGTTAIFEEGATLALLNSRITFDNSHVEFLGARVTDRENALLALGGATSTITIGRDSGLVFRNGATSRIENSVFSYLQTALSYDATSPIWLDNVHFEHNITALDIVSNATTTLFRDVMFSNNTTDTTNEVPQ